MTKQTGGQQKKAVKASAASVAKDSKKPIKKTPTRKRSSSKTTTSPTKRSTTSKSTGKSSNATKKPVRGSTTKSTTKPKKTTKNSKSSKMSNKKGKKETVKAPSTPKVAAKVHLPAYRQLKQNLYRAPLQRPPFDLHSDANLECSCRLEDGGCNEHCHNRLLYTECIPELCRCTQQNPNDPKDIIYCQNTIIQRQAFPPCEVFPTSQCGFALRVLQAVPANTLLTEYMGEVITTDEYDQRLRNYHQQDNLYFALLGNQLMLDANKMGSIARFANHSCEPNCLMQKWSVKNECRIVLVSLRPLQALEEITYNYHFYNVDEINSNKATGKKQAVQYQTCHCGSRLCTGIVGGGNSQTNQLVEEKVPKLIQRGQLIQTSTIKSDTTSSSSSTSSVFTKEALQQFLQQSQEVLVSLATSRLQNDLQVQQLQQLIANISPKYQSLLQWEQTVETEILSHNSGWQAGLRPPGSTAPVHIKRDTDATFISRTEIHKHLDTFPLSNIRSKHFQALKQMLAQHLTVCQAVRSFLSTHNFDLTVCDRTIASIKQEAVKRDAGEEINAVTEVSSSSISSERPLVYNWHDLLPLWKQISEVFPLAVPCTDLILSHYLQMCSWIQQHLSRYIPTDFVDMKHREHHSLDRLYQACINSVLLKHSLGKDNEISEFGRMLSIEDISRLHQLPSDIFKAMSYLNTFLNVAITRDETKKKNQQHLKCSDEESLYCVCQLPENDSLCTAFTQCTGCEQWYHLPCLNYPVVAVKQVSQQDHFYCHTCQLLQQQRLSGFALTPNSEWKYFEAKERKTYEEQMKKRGIMSKKAPTKPPVQQEAAKQEAVSLEPVEQAVDSTLSTTTGAVAPNPTSTTVDKVPQVKCVPFADISMPNYSVDSKAMLQAVQEYWKLSRGSRKYKQFFDFEDLLKLIADSKPLPIKETPAIDILDFMEVKALNWKARVETFLTANHDSLIAAINTYIHSKAEVSKDSEEATMLSTLYQDLLHLYYEMYIYHIKYTVLLESLRVWIWIIACIPVLRAIAAVQQTATATNEMDVHNTSTVSLEELQEVYKASGWMKKRCSKGSVQLQYVQQIQRFHDDITTVLQQASRCTNSMQAMADAQQLQRYNRFIGLGHCFGFAKVACFLRPAQLKLQLADLQQRLVTIASTQHEDTNQCGIVTLQDVSSTPISAGVQIDTKQSIATLQQYLDSTETDEEMFCWCRRGEDRGLMVCCDRCEDWFHAACIGISLKYSRHTTAATSQSIVGNKKKRKIHQVSASSLQQEDASFLCLSCSSLLQREYPYAW